MTVTGRFAAGIGITPVTGVEGLLVDDTFFEENKSLCRLEGRSRGIGTHDRTVEEGLEEILGKDVVITPPMPSGKEVRIIRRGGDHTENFAGGGINHYDTAYFVMHEHFAIGL
jgi:hypothetical protein